MKFACVEALKTCKFFPKVAELREFAFQWVPPAEAAPPAIFRESKPPDWKADFSAASADAAASFGRKSGFTREQINEMLETGKETQREYIAKLEADPQWCALRDKLVQRDFKPRPTEIPPTPAERAQWARDTAEKRGWL